jgi:hypothetical protein
VAYIASGIRSPSKGTGPWVHRFGDRGEGGHGRTSMDVPSTFSEQLMPRLDQDQAGNLFIARRSANAYTVNEWIDE